MSSRSVRCGLDYILQKNRPADDRNVLGKKSPSASLFRVEMLGLCCVHLLARAVAEFFGTGQWEAFILCDTTKEPWSYHKTIGRGSDQAQNVLI
jgi:hypothetical protein